jgi:hypothetical protein
MKLQAFRARALNFLLERERVRLVSSYSSESSATSSATATSSRSSQKHRLVSSYSSESSATSSATSSQSSQKQTIAQFHDEDKSFHFDQSIDTLSMTKELLKNGFTQEQSEGAVKMLVSALNRSVTHAELAVEAQRNRHKFERYTLITDAKIERANAKSETVGKDLQQEAEKIRSELRYNIEKINQSSRLDLNLEKGRITDQLTLIDNKLLGTELRLDREIQSIRTSLEAKVNDIIRYGLGTMVSIGALGLGFLRFLT